MIQFSLDKPLSILLPNTNKALAEVLKTASPTELASLTKHKDLGSLLNSIFQKSAQDPAQNATLLKLIQNNPTLKSLGSVTATLQNLSQLLTEEKTPLPLEKILKNFVGDVKNMSEKELKSKLENAGIFLELKNKAGAQTPLPLETTLKNLMGDIKNMSEKELKGKLENAGIFLESKLKNNAQTQLPLEKILKNFVGDVKNMTEKELKSKLENAGIFLELKNKAGAQTPLPLETTLKNLMGDIKNMSENELKSRLENAGIFLESKPKAGAQTPLPLETALKNLMGDIKNISEKELKSKLENSGIFLESKLKATAEAPLQKELFTNDLKAVLLRTQEELTNATTPKAQEILKQVDKLLLQIDYYQLSSHLANGSSLYIPYSWDALEDGNLTLKKGKDERYFCDIELHLKEYGELKLRLGLFYKNQLSINITTESQSLKDNIKEHLGGLKKQLLSVGVTPLEIRFLEEKNIESYGDDTQDVGLGFEVKV